MDITEQQVFDALKIENTETQPTETIAEGSPAAVTPEEQGTGNEQAMSADERHENAARRRKQEQQAAIDAAVTEALNAERERTKAREESFFKRAKLKNTVDGSPINTMEEFDSWEKQFNEAKLNQNLRAGKLTRDDLDALIEEHPKVKAASEIAEREAEAQRQRQNDAAQQKIAEEIAEISKMDPTIKGMQDLVNAPYGKEFYEYVKKGLTFVEAFKLANGDAIRTAAAEAAKNSALSNARSKGHLTNPGNSRGAGAVSVPNDELAMFRLLNPKASNDDIQAYYNKYYKK